LDPGDANPTLSAFSPSSGLPGTVVTITGASLTDVLSVKFNNTNAFFKYEGGDLSAVVPANATSGTISITTGGGSVTSSATFNVIQITGVIPKSSVSAVMPNNNPVGWPILIKGANIDSIRGIKFGNIVGQIDTNFSGVLTTRVPNGVTAGPLVNLMRWHATVVPGRPGTRVAQFSALSFDASAHELLSALFAGKTLFLLDAETRRNPAALAAWLDPRIRSATA